MPQVLKTEPEVHTKDNKKPWAAGPSGSITPLSLMSPTSGESARTVAASAPTSASLPGTEQLPPVDLHFTSVPELLSYLETASDNPHVDSVTVASVMPKYFTDIDQALQDRGRKVRLFFFAEEKLLIITIPNSPHERLHTGLNRALTDEINDMGCKYSWITNGATRYPPDLPPNSSASRGEGDSSGGPSPERLGDGSWPTIVFEAGSSQSLESLRMKIRFWFARSNHDVKIVILAKAFPNDHAQKRILIEQWQEHLVSRSNARPGATTTRQSAVSGPATVLEPVCVQTINVVWAVPGVTYNNASRAQKLDPQSFNVIRGPLRLEFARLFLRQPIGPREDDIVLSDYRLSWIASSVWL